MREIRPSGSEGGVAPTRHPYPYPIPVSEFGFKAHSAKLLFGEFSPQSEKPRFAPWLPTFVWCVRLLCLRLGRLGRFLAFGRAWFLGGFSGFGFLGAMTALFGSHAGLGFGGRGVGGRGAAGGGGRARGEW